MACCRRYAQAIVVGGLLNTPQQVASFGGGQVWDYNVVTTLTSEFSNIKSAAEISDSDAVPSGFPGNLPQDAQE